MSYGGTFICDYSGICHTYEASVAPIVWAMVDVPSRVENKLLYFYLHLI